MSGRGRLSSIELLGEEYDDILTWVAGELRERRQLQIDLLPEFNKRLISRAEEIGDDLSRIKPPGVTQTGPDWPISKSAFSRHAVALAEDLRRVDEIREVSAVLCDRLQPGDTDDVTIYLAQLIKSAVAERIREDGRGKTPLMELNFAATALKSAEAALKASTDRRAKLEAAKRQAAEEAARAATAAVLDRAEETAREAGLPAERIAQLKRDLLGVRDKPKASA